MKNSVDIATLFESILFSTIVIVEVETGGSLKLITDEDVEVTFHQAGLSDRDWEVQAKCDPPEIGTIKFTDRLIVKELDLAKRGWV
ncbi:MAG: hypothetical protein AB7M93_30750 [Candidatus Obscuribacterales bacterium]